MALPTVASPSGMVVNHETSAGATVSIRNYPEVPYQFAGVYCPSLKKSKLAIGR